MSYDQDLVRGLLGRLSPTARTFAATVALDRIRVVLRGDDLPEIRRVVDDATEFGFGQVLGGAAADGDASEILDRLSALLGPEEDEDALDDDEFWAFYVMATAEAVMQGWMPEADSVECCLNALLYAYTVADYLEVHRCGPSAWPFADLEADRQAAGLRYLGDPDCRLDGAAIEWMRSDSAGLRNGYAERIREILACGRRTRADLDG
jgi:hypothetical protein